LLSLDKAEQLLCFEEEEEFMVSGVCCHESSIEEAEKLLIVPEGSVKKACSSTSSFSPYTYLFLFQEQKKDHSHITHKYLHVGTYYKKIK